MRSRQYSWNLKRLAKTYRINVYADRSVEIMVEHADTGEVKRRANHLQTREEAAFFLAFARHEYVITRTHL